MTDPRQIQAYHYARDAIGTAEIPGAKHNPKVVGWFADVGHAWVKDDETAWCAAFIGAMLVRAGLADSLPPVHRRLAARSYLDWGEEVPLSEAEEGDVVVFWRGSPSGWQGHVGFFVKTRGDKIMVCGGNQSNKVSVAPYAASRLLGVRRMSAPSATAQPRSAPVTPISPVRHPDPAEQPLGWRKTALNWLVSAIEWIEERMKRQ